MFEQALRISEAQRHVSPGALAPALIGCVDCGAQWMITSPEPRSCAGCGARLTVLATTHVVVADTRRRPGFAVA